MRRGAIFESVQHAAELALHHRFVIARNAEGLVHHIWLVVTDRAGGKLHAIADNVVLEGSDAENFLFIIRAKLQELVERIVRHREGIVREVDLLLFLVPLEHGEVHDPAELEDALFHKAKLGADTRARQTGKACKLRRHAGHEEDGITFLKTKLGTDRLGPFRSDVLCHWPRPFEAATSFAEEDITEARRPRALRPGVHPVAEGTVAAGGCRDRPDLNLRVLLDHSRKDLETRAAEMVGNILHL